MPANSPPGSGDLPPTQPGTGGEQQPLTVSWSEVHQRSIQDHQFLELTPGIVITDIPDGAGVDWLNEYIARALAYASPDGRFAATLDQVQPVFGMMQRVAQGARAYALQNLRAVIIEPDEDHLKALGKRRRPDMPAVSVVYIADATLTGVGPVSGAVTVLRTYAAGLIGGAQKIDDPDAPWRVMLKSKGAPGSEWTERMRESRRLGWYAVARAIAFPAQAGAPGTSRWHS